MSGNTLTDADISPGKPVMGVDGFGKKVKDMFSDIFGTLNTIRTDQVKNGSFEQCTLADGKTPDNWTVTDYPGGSHSLDNANAKIGGLALALVHPGGASNGGGYAETDYYECYPANFVPNNLFLTFSWWHKASNAAMKNLFYVRFFDASHVWISDEVLWCNLDTNALGSASTYRWYCGLVLPPANAVYYKLRVVGGESTVNQAGTAWFDGILKIDERPGLYDIGTTISPRGLGSEWGWSDLATVPLPIMFSTSQRISFSVSGTFDTLRPNDGYNGPVSVRFRIGSLYSASGSNSALDSWESHALSVSADGYTPPSKYMAIVMQGTLPDLAAIGGQVRKSLPGTKIIICSDNALPTIAV